MTTSTISKDKNKNVLFQDLLFFPASISISSVCQSGDSLHYTLISNSDEGTCPFCHQLSQHPHSRYIRHLQDIPMSSFHVSLEISLRKFYCRNPLCSHHIFAAPIPELALPYQRYTCRAAELVVQTTLVTSGQNSSRLLEKQKIYASRNTCNRLLIKQPVPECKSVYIGMDDFAFRKGHTYGTLLVDLLNGRPVALLPDRQAETVGRWLSKHPFIQYVSRDGASCFANAVQRGIPLADSIRDKFHLMKNLSDIIIEYVLSQIKKASVKERFKKPDVQQIHQELWSGLLAMGDAIHREKVKRYIEVHRLLSSGYKIGQIAQIMNISSCNIHRHKTIRLDQVLTPQQQLLLKNLNKISGLIAEGSTNSTTIAQTCKGINSRMIARLTKDLRKKWKKERTEIKEKNKMRQEGGRERIGYKTLFRQFFEEGYRSTHQKLNALIDKSPEIRSLIHLCLDFRKMMNGKIPSFYLNKWIVRAKKTGISKICAFGKSMQQDIEAIYNSIDIPMSNGIVEGNVNRVKLIKRSMYGRARIILLTKKVLA